MTSRHFPFDPAPEPLPTPTRILVRDIKLRIVNRKMSINLNEEDIDPFTYHPPFTKWDYLKVPHSNGLELNNNV